MPKKIRLAVSRIFVGSLSLFSIAPAFGAAPCTNSLSPISGDSLSISASCSDLVLNGAGNINISAPAIISANAGIAIDSSRTANNIATLNIIGASIFTETKTPDGNAYGIFSSPVSSLTNSSSAVITDQTPVEMGTNLRVVNGNDYHDAIVTTINISHASPIFIGGAGSGNTYGIYNTPLGKMINSSFASITNETPAGRDGDSRIVNGDNLQGGIVATINNNDASIISATHSGSGNVYGIFNASQGILSNRSTAYITAQTSEGSGKSLSVVNGDDFHGSPVIDINNVNASVISARNSGGGDVYGIYNAPIGSLVNTSSAVITGRTSNGSIMGYPNVNGVDFQHSVVTTLVNDGGSIISAVGTGGGNAFAIYNAAQATLDNSSSSDITVQTSGGVGSVYPIVNGNDFQGGVVTTVNNSGASVITAASTGSGHAYGIHNTPRSTLNNTSTAAISGGTQGGGGMAYPIVNGDDFQGGAVSTINNSHASVISAVSNGRGNAYAIYNAPQSALKNTSVAATSGQISAGNVTDYRLVNGEDIQAATVTLINNSNASVIEASSMGNGHAYGVYNVARSILSNSSSAALTGDITGGTGATYRTVNGDDLQAGTVTTINNTSGSRISASTSGSGNAYGIYNSPQSSLTNISFADISGQTTAGHVADYRIVNGEDIQAGTITTITNSGGSVIAASSHGSGNSYGIYNTPYSTLTNSSSGIISGVTTSGTPYRLINGDDIKGGTVTTINNIDASLIVASSTGGGSAYGIYNAPSIDIADSRSRSILDKGAAYAAINGDDLHGSTVTTINNVSSSAIVAISTGGGNAYGVYNAPLSTIVEFNNHGAIAAVAPNGVAIGISNAGAITTLNNSQGGNATSAATTALTYDGNLPTNYNPEILSSNHYGQLSVTNPEGAITNFGIYGTPFITSRTYAGVLTNNVAVTNIQSKYDNMSLALLNNRLTGLYDLKFTGASLMGTQQSLSNTANALAPVFAMQNAVLVNSFTYDCTLFDVNNMCISAGGRNTQISAANGLYNSSALLIAAYRPHLNYRVGGYADQNTSVNNSGSTVTLSNNIPLIGLFGAWAENHEGPGAEVRISLAYGKKGTSINRQVVGLSEPGSGSSNLNSQGAQITAKYGLGIMEALFVSPYVGMRYTQNNMAGYSEGSTSAVTEPLTYSALNTNATTALAGLGTTYKVIPKVTTFASVGLESDTKTTNGTYSATGINGLTPVNFNPNLVRTRPTASLGAYYDTAKNQRFGVSAIYRQEPFQAVASTTIMATYTVGL